MVINLKYKILVPILVITCVFLLKFSITKDKISKYEIVYEKVEQVTHDVYYYDNDKLVYVTISFDNNIEVKYLFDLLTNKSNTINNSYDTKLIVSTILINYEIEDKCLTVNLSEDFLRYNDNDAYSIFVQLRNTFSNLGYETLLIKVEEELLQTIGYINISNGITLSNI